MFIILVKISVNGNQDKLSNLAGITQKRAMKALFSLWSLQKKKYGVQNTQGKRKSSKNLMQTFKY